MLVRLTILSHKHNRLIPQYLIVSDIIATATIIDSNSVFLRCLDCIMCDRIVVAKRNVHASYPYFGIVLCTRIIHLISCLNTFSKVRQTMTSIQRTLDNIAMNNGTILL